MTRYPVPPTGTREMPRENDDSREPRRGPAWDEMSGNRKLIRPSLTDINKEPAGNRDSGGSRQARKRPVPSDSTNAENFYYVKQMQSKTLMVIVLTDGEILHGVIEWYDRACIKVHRTGEPNLLLYKTSIKYLYKENEGD